MSVDKSDLIIQQEAIRNNPHAAGCPHAAGIVGIAHLRILDRAIRFASPTPRPQPRRLLVGVVRFG